VIGIVGYGEVGRILAEDLARGVARIGAYDVKLGTAQERPLREHAARYDVVLAASHADLAANVDLVVSAVTASQTLAVAQAWAPAIRRDTWFLDFNSASPGAKAKAAAMIDGAGGRFVEGAVMTSVPPHRIRVPLLLGGPHAAHCCRCSMRSVRAKVASEKLGVASATKMCRRS
jgi:3-hydroxyisobutyrate dehydrogenase-like beta-hydroxyacid dehydrogenase